jgi:hypothetical protein
MSNQFIKKTNLIDGRETQEDYIYAKQQQPRMQIKTSKPEVLIFLAVRLKAVSAAANRKEHQGHSRHRKKRKIKSANILTFCFFFLLFFSSS